MKLHLIPRPCPFCSYPKPVKSAGGRCMVCPNCLAHGPTDPEVSAEDGWDTRHQEEKFRDDAIEATQKYLKLSRMCLRLMRARGVKNTLIEVENLIEYLEKTTP